MILIFYVFVGVFYVLISMAALFLAAAYWAVLIVVAVVAVIVDDLRFRIGRRKRVRRIVSQAKYSNRR